MHTSISVFHYKNGYYLEFYSGFPYKGTMMGKFDTGAAKTLISLGKLFNEAGQGSIGHRELGAKSEALMDKYSDRVTAFTSASGHKIPVIPVVARNVRMQGTTISEFFYWMTPMLKTKFLLGDDFSMACDYTHKCNENIVITRFHEEKYLDFHYKKIRARYIRQEEIEEFICEPVRKKPQFKEIRNGDENNEAYKLGNIPRISIVDERVWNQDEKGKYIWVHNQKHYFSKQDIEMDGKRPYINVNVEEKVYLKGHRK